MPAGSSLYPRAQIGLARVLIDLHNGGPSLEICAGHRSPSTPWPPKAATAAQLRTELFENALRLLRGRDIQRDASVRLLDRPLEEGDLRRGLEESLRGLARWETDRKQQIKLIDRANAVRPVTWV